MYSQQRLSPPAQFALLLVFCGGGIVLSSVITGLIAGGVMHIPLDKLADELMKPENVDLSRLLQIFTSFLIMAIPALAVNYLNGRKPVTQIGFNENMNIIQVGLVVLMVFVGFFLSGALGELNQMIPLSKELKNYFDKLEQNYNDQVMAITNMKTINDYFYSLLVLAIVPAVFEEMLFRGTLQQIFISWLGKPFWGILITSVIFSAIHISFFGFLPRLFLGLMLGYIFYYSKNLWLSVIAHFFNNAYSVTAIYSLSKSGKLTNDAMSDTYPWIYMIPSFAIMILLFYVYRKESNKLLAKKALISNEHERLV